MSGLGHAFKLLVCPCASLHFCTPRMSAFPQPNDNFVQAIDNLTKGLILLNIVATVAEFSMKEKCFIQECFGQPSQGSDASLR